MVSHTELHLEHGTSTVDIDDFDKTDNERQKDESPAMVENISNIPSDESKYLTGRRLHTISAGLLTAIFIVQMESSIISTAIVDITDHLGGYGKSSWLFEAYFVTYCGRIVASFHDYLLIIRMPPNDLGESLRHYRAETSHPCCPLYLCRIFWIVRCEPVFDSIDHVSMVSRNRRLRCVCAGATYFL